MNESLIPPKKPESCPECGATQILIDKETGEKICQQCGIVISTTMINTEPEWRAFDAAQRENLPRTGAPTTLLLHDQGLSTNISWKNRDASGRELSSEAKSRLYRLRKWHQRSKISDGYDRNLKEALKIITGLQQRLNLPKNVVETSSHLYRNALKSNLIRGRSIKTVSAASIYMACRQCKIVRSLDDVAGCADLSRQEVARNYRFLVRMLGSNVPQVDPGSYIGKITNTLGLMGGTERVANILLLQASSAKLTNGRAPAGIAAACVYISSRVLGESVTQGDIARSAGVTEVTIRNRYKELVNKLEININL